MATKATERQRRYRIREKARAQAVFAKATEIELAWFGVNRDGEHVAIGIDGKPIQLIVRTSVRVPESPNDHIGSTAVLIEPAPTPENVIPLSKPKKVYAPKSWDPTKWNVVVEAVQSQHMGRARFIEKMQTITGIDDKQRKHAIAVAEAIPDTPDWCDGLPTAAVTEP